MSEKRENQRLLVESYVHIDDCIAFGSRECWHQLDFGLCSTESFELSTLPKVLAAAMVQSLLLVEQVGAHGGGTVPFSFEKFENEVLVIYENYAWRVNIKMSDLNKKQKTHNNDESIVVNVID